MAKDQSQLGGDLKPQTDPIPSPVKKSRLVSTTSSAMSVGTTSIQRADKLKISNFEALLHIVKATIGGGFLAIPEAFRHVGVLVGCVGSVIIGLVVLNMLVIIVNCSQALRSGKLAAAILANRKKENVTEANEEGEDVSKQTQTEPNDDGLILPPMDYPDTVSAVFEYGARGRFSSWAPFFKHFTSISLIFTYYGVNIIYVCIVSGTLKQLVDQYTANGAEDSWSSFFHDRSIRWYPTLVAPLIVSVGMIRLMKYLIPFSMIANASLVVGAGVVFYFVFADNEMIPLEPHEQAKWIVTSIPNWSLFVGSVLCSMEGVGMLLHIENAMRKPRELTGSPYTLHWSMVVIIILNGSLGLFGYLKYGERCAGSISLNLPSNNVLSESTKMTIALGILFTYGLQLTVTSDLAWRGLRKKLVKNTENDTEDENKDSPKLSLYYYTMRLGLILGTILVATIVPDIGPLVSLVGAVGFSMLGLMVPVFLDTVWNWYPTQDDGDEQDRSSDNNGNDQAAGGNVVARAVINSGAMMTVIPMGKKMMETALAIGGKPENPTSMSRRRVFYRGVRHAKNIFILILAFFALIGGAIFNIRDILDKASEHGSTASANN